MSFELMSRERAEGLVPLTDCSGREYGKDEREDIIRYVLLGAEMQMFKDEDTIRNNEYLEARQAKKRY